MTIHLLAARRGFIGNGPRCYDRHYSIIINGQNVDLDQPTWDAIWAKSLSERITIETAYAAVID